MIKSPNGFSPRVPDERMIYGQTFRTSRQTGLQKRIQNIQRGGHSSKITGHFLELLKSLTRKTDFES